MKPGHALPPDRSSDIQQATEICTTIGGNCVLCGDVAKYGTSRPGGKVVPFCAGCLIAAVYVYYTKVIERYVPPVSHELIEHDGGSDLFTTPGKVPRLYAEMEGDDEGMGTEGPRHFLVGIAFGVILGICAVVILWQIIANAG